MTTLWATIIVLGVLIFVHELGHYLAARSIGVRVNRFSIGYPPRLITFTSVPGGWNFRFFFFKKNDKGKFTWQPVKKTFLSRPGRKGSLTEYCLAVLPLGGYVKVAGIIDESLDTDIKHEPDELMSKSRLAQIWFMSAGVIMNIVLAFFIFTGVSYYTGKPIVSNEPVIAEVVPSMPAEKSGVRPGDRITHIDENPVETWEELTALIHNRPNQSLSLTYTRENRTQTLQLESTYTLNPNTGDTLGIVGIYPQYEYVPVSITESLNAGWSSTVRGFGMIVLSIKMLVSGEASIKDLGGPIMIAQIAGETAKAGWVPLLMFMGLISCNLAFINVLPIPGLDGGHIMVTLIEGILRKPLTFRVRMAIQQVGMALLLLLMITVILNDIGRLFSP